MAADDFIAEILSRDPRKSGPVRRASRKRGEYFSAIDDEVLGTVIYRIGLYEDWRDIAGLTAADLYSMAYEEPVQYRVHPSYLGWRAYLNAAALREVTREND